MRAKLLFALALSALPSAAWAQRVELPIREVDLSNGERRYATTLTIDGKPVEVGIDTGSTGLRVLPRGLGADALAAKGPGVDYAYGAGTAFKGAAIKVVVAAGALAGPIRIMRIDRVGCVSAKPDCPASRVDAAGFGIQGDGLPGEGFAAILGIRLRDDTVGNPFVELGAKRWVITLPRAGDGSGKIVLNPTDDEIAGFRRFAVDQNGNVPGCIVGATARQKACGRTFFDTGATGLRVLSADRFVPWPNGTAATLAVGDGSSVATMAVEIGRRDQASGLIFVPTADAREPRLSFGLAPYFRWSVLYDAGRREIGIAPR